MPPMASAARTCIVVPAYNEEQRFDGAALEAYLGAATAVEFVLVDDGSTDATRALLEGVAERWPGRVQVLALARNVGKAEAVRQGMLCALERENAEFVGYWDADWATPLADIDKFVACFSERPFVDIVMGARVALLGRHIERSPLRHYLGRVAATAASLVLWLTVYDTQCGAKLFRARSSKRLFATPFIAGWVFDVELLARYRQEGGSARGIFELPLDSWRDVGDSKVRPLDFLRAFADLAKIHRRYRR